MLAVATAQQYEFDIYAYREHIYDVDPENPDWNLHFHCVEVRVEGNRRIPRSVHGSYGRRGYFEGYFSFSSPYNALISMYETRPVWQGAAKTMAGAITYDPSFNSFSGSTIGAGQTSIGWLEELYSMNQCTDCVPSFLRLDLASNTYILDNEAKVAFAEENCLWSPYWMRPPQNMNNEIFSAPNSSEVFTTAGVGPADTNGQLLGAYTYHYSEQQCADLQLDCARLGSNETGYYAMNGVSAYLMDSRVVATNWFAVSGPMAGRNGTYIAIIRLNTFMYYADWSEGTISGFWCVSETPTAIQHSTSYRNCQPAHAKRTHRSKDDGRNLLNAYATLVDQPKKGNVLYALKWFANKAFGKWIN